MFQKLEQEIQTLIGKKDTIWGVTTQPPINLITMDWRPWLPTFEPQRFIYDTDECSQLGGCINRIEQFMNWQKATGKIPQAALDFFTENGYFDSNGSFSFSERFTAILDGTSINGNTMQNAWKCVQKYGLIPRSMLNWTLQNAAQFPNQSLMDTSYYNPAVITQAMMDIGEAFKKVVGVSWGWVGNGITDIPVQVLQKGLQTSPLAICIPIPNPTIEWNGVEVPYTGNITMDHCVGIDFIDESNPYSYFINDQYQPFQKQLQAGYYIPNAIAFFITYGI